MFRDNALRKRLQAGRKALGCWLSLGNAAAAEIVGLAGYDWVMIDHEHGPGDLQSAVAQIAGARALRDDRPPPRARLRRRDDQARARLRRRRHHGADGRDGRARPKRSSPPAATRRAASAARRPRSCAPADYGLAEADYIERFEDELLILCQIETPTGIENIEEIAAVDGVDILFVGPSDISTNLGYAKERGPPGGQEGPRRGRAPHQGDRQVDGHGLALRHEPPRAFRARLRHGLRRLGGELHTQDGRRAGQGAPGGSELVMLRITNLRPTLSPDSVSDGYGTGPHPLPAAHGIVCSWARTAERIE